MKKIAFALAALFALQGMRADDGTLKISGHIGGLEDTLYIAIVDMADRQGYKQDTFVVSNGNLDITLQLAKPVQLSGFTPAQLRAQRDVTFSAIGVPNETLVLDGSVEKGCSIGGSKFYTDYNVFRTKGNALIDSIRAINRDYAARVANGEKEGDLMPIVEKKERAIMDSLNRFMLSYVRQHSNDDAAAAVAVNLNGDDFDKALAMLSPDVRNGKMKTYIDEYKVRKDEQKAHDEAAAKAQASGVQAPDFTLKDINGKPLSLSSLRGKYVVLDFWGSWCVWCIKGFPKMKEYYEKYRDKVEILGIDCNDTEAKWKAAVTKHQLPWLQVYNQKGDNDVTSVFVVSAFPTKILIDPNGKIVKTYVGEDPTFYEFLDNTFGK